MKSLLLAWPAAARSFLVRLLAKVRAQLTASFYSRPALKRGLLVFGLFTALALPLGLLAGQWGVVAWALVLAALFLGMGAERASTDWSEVFALPALRNFAFWRWHALERKRYVAALTALAIGFACSMALALLYGGL